MKKIGIIGGAGPEAGSLLFNNIIHKYQEIGCWNDHDFPTITLLSYPFSSMIETEDANNHKQQIINQLQSAVNFLEKANSEIIVLACNTLHTFVPNITFNKAQFVSMVENTIDEMVNKNITTVLFLGSNTSSSASLYTNTALDVIYPIDSEQRGIMSCIFHVLKNQIQPSDITTLQQIIYKHKQSSNIQAAVLGCTELSVLHNRCPLHLDYGIQVIDPVSIVAKKIVASSY